MRDAKPQVRRTAVDASGQPSGYDLRFGERERSATKAVWRGIGRFLQRRYVPEASRIIDTWTRGDRP